MTVVDARFAGGQIAVQRGELDGQPVVDLVLPGAQRIPLRLHEADNLANALLERGEYTEEGTNRREAAENVVLGRDAGTLNPSHVLFVNTYPLELDQPAALAFASRLIELAAQLPAPPRILRRRTDVDAHLTLGDV
ncbi:hypothetical protein [Microbacterium allomyrinae]|uniref:Uncharacterized protein n=1 Tax=Microbacterium allomyrinae TaxID=2830666 RepID=A0A9X1S370_9MICO|nr:hypothetical protein [Microbacterium allomyrinae]MCC2032187.1 hypothetical protein [Microbacterium allomyrinae]